MAFNEIASKLKPVASPIALCLIVVIYVCIGASIFSAIEHKYEAEKQQLELEKLIRISSRFEHLLALSLNISDKSVRLNQKELVQIVSYWSKIAYDPSLTSLAVNNATSNETKWGFLQSVLFTYSLVTTVGYGVLTPQTFEGRFFCICYSIVGIPLTMLTIANLGKFLSIWLIRIQWRGRRVYRWCRSHMYKLTDSCCNKSDSTRPHQTNSDEDSELLSPFTLIFSILLLIILGSLILPSLEDMDFFTACYFTFISITTVGFGDVVPQANPCPTLLYLTIGLALTTIAVEMGADLLLKLHYLGRKFCNAKNVRIRFGGRKLTVNDMVRAVGLKFRIPMWEIEEFTNNMDGFIEQTFVDKKMGKLYPKPQSTLLTTHPELVFKIAEIHFVDHTDAN